MANDKLSPNPQTVSPTLWYYERPRGVELIVEVRDVDCGMWTGQALRAWLRRRAEEEEQR